MKVKLEESFLYAHVGHKVYSEIQDIENGIELVTEAMVAFKDNEIKKITTHDINQQRELLIATLICTIDDLLPEDHFIRLSNSYKKLKSNDE